MQLASPTKVSHSVWASWYSQVGRCLDPFGMHVVCVCVAAYSIQGQNVQIISPSSESHQQVVAVGQPLSAQPQGTVVVRQKYSQNNRGLICMNLYASFFILNNLTLCFFLC